MARIFPEKSYFAFAPSVNNKMGTQSLMFAPAIVQLSRSHWRTKDAKAGHLPLFLLDNPPCLCETVPSCWKHFHVFSRTGQKQKQYILNKLTLPLDNTGWGNQTQNTNAEFNITALYLNESIVCTWDRKGVEKDVKAYLSTEICSYTYNKILVMVHFNGISFLLITKCNCKLFLLTDKEGVERRSNRKNIEMRRIKYTKS